jgi:hypothetical protein
MNPSRHQSMKPFRLISLGWTAAAVALFLTVAAGARGANATNVTGKAGAVTNAAPAELPVPKSVFDLTAVPSKDPFFPLSVRQPVPTATNTLAFSASSFLLKGLSGSSGRRLALINNRTLADGETTEITTAAGKVKIHCVQIKESSVIIRADNQSETIEVFLRKSAQ